MNEEARIQSLLSKYYDDRITEIEFDELFELLKKNEAQFQVEISNLFKNRRTIHSGYIKQEWEGVVDNILKQDNTVPVRSIRWSKWVAAACVLILIGSGLYYFGFHKKEENIAAINLSADAEPGGNKAVLTLGNGKKIILDNADNGILAQEGNTKITKLADGQLAYSANASGSATNVLNTMSTPRGGQYQLRLPDGTLVWMNAASSITYPTSFNSDERVVEASGEIYFEIAKDTKRPFKVALPSRSEIVVLGTHFNINTYTDEPVQKITLLEGKIAVQQEQQKTVLKPGQQAEINAAITINNTADIEEVMAWKNGNFKFKGNDIKSIMRQVSRWYDLEVVYEGNVPTGHYNGAPSRKLTAMQMLKLVEYSGVKVRIEGKKVIIGSK
jgi:transmembrane sensor